MASGAPAFAATSGTRRHVPDDVAQDVEVEVTPSDDGAAVWNVGMSWKADTPPPPAPTLLFHTASVAGGPTDWSVVPPTPVTNGWLAGSSTASAVRAEPRV